MAKGMRRRRGATGVEYGLLVGLLALAVIAAVAQTGTSVAALFDTARNALDVPLGGDAASSDGGGSGGTQTPPPVQYAYAGSACDSGWTYNGSTCTQSGQRTVTLSSNTLSASSCNDHHLVAVFTPETANKVTVTLYNYGPAGTAQPGNNCSYASLPMGELVLQPDDGSQFSEISDIGQIAFAYTSAGEGCDAMSGTTTGTDTFLGGTEISYCPGGGAQYPDVTITASGSATVTATSTKAPACPAGQQVQGGDCYAPVNG